MLDVKEVCRLKWSMTKQSDSNCFNDPRNDPDRREAMGRSRDFIGCPACIRQAETMTMDEIRADMEAFLQRSTCPP